MTTQTAQASPISYNDEIVKYFSLATVFWGIIGFTVGLFIALQMAFPALNFEPFLTFGRLRPLHTSAVIFAFGGNALFATSYYIVQRTCQARLWNDALATFTFYGYQLVIVMAALGYVTGVTQGKEYAEPEWYVDLWLTIVWVAYLIEFLMTVIKRKEPHIYICAMWVSGIMQGLMWRSYDNMGFLEYSFVESVMAMHPFYILRALGGSLYLGGALIMAYNFWRTIRGDVSKTERSIQVQGAAV